MARLGALVAAGLQRDRRPRLPIVAHGAASVAIHSRHCERSEAIQHESAAALDCFVALSRSSQ